ncbi:hypothetical protein AJ79_00730 [Helicocarpus griseus UAMH5409]|uniref:Uncharacterized protein n=1 Tax=Helicocarpus griseus UAMH5409 TaxID=1447875 RepID=A0A2B7YB54_9EURO|nr:hypothetical protein AJ79_00730 [Helicocarpus griseus UAMH5409]
MKVAFCSSLLSAFALQQAIATYGTPDKGHCSDIEKHGFDWSDLESGEFKDWKGFEFSGFVSNKFSTKDLFGKKFENMFEDKQAIEAKITKDVGGPSFSKEGGFAVKKFKMSADKEADFEITYTMPDGSKCKQVSHSKPEGAEIENTKCGGAVAVEFGMSASIDDDMSATIAIHNIDFDCDDYPTAPCEKCEGAPPAPPHAPMITPCPEPIAPPKPTYTTIYTTTCETISSCPSSVHSCPPDAYPTVITKTIPIIKTIYPTPQPPMPTYGHPGYNATVCPPATLSKSIHPSGTVGPYPPMFTGAGPVVKGSVVFVAAGLLLASFTQL